MDGIQGRVETADEIGGCGGVGRFEVVVESVGGRAGDAGGWTDVMTEAVMVVGIGR